jgi:hypothetical protein
MADDETTVDELDDEEGEPVTPEDDDDEVPFEPTEIPDPGPIEVEDDEGAP